MEFYGLTHPNPDGRAGGGRRDVSRLRGAAIHIAVAAPSTQSAEAVARYQSTQRTTHSGYHSLFDSDGHLRYFPDDRVAYGARGGSKFGSYNTILIHLSAACNTTTWARYKNWSKLTYGHMAPEIQRLHETYDWPLRVVTKAEFDRGVLGFLTHQRLDPARRRDPGAIVDGSGEFSFEYLFGLVQGDTPEMPDPREEDVMFIKHGDDGVLVRQLQHTVNAIIVYTGGWHVDSEGDLMSPDGKFGNKTAERAQHAIWRAEGWVLGYPLYGEEEGGSRITTATFTSLLDVMHGLRNGVYDTNPSTDVSQSGVNLSDAKAVAEWVRQKASQ